MVTMAEVAARAGVAKQTVSNVLTGKAAVRPATAARVHAAIAELGYTPNLVARSLATGSTMTVGLFVATVANPFYSEVVEQVENALDGSGYHLLLCTTRGDGRRARRHLESLTSRNIDALLIAGDSNLIDQLPLLADVSFPVALCAWETEIPDSLPVVTIDYEQAGFLAGRHLRELGHRKVAVIAERPHEWRLEGLRRAFARDGLTVGDEWVFEPPVSSPEGGYTAAVRALAAHPDLTAIFTTNDVLALGALDAVHESGRSVPGQVSVVGFDDIAQVGRTHPALTTVAIPKREMAEQAVRLLLNAIAEQRPPTNSLQLLRPRLIPRASSGPAPAGD